MFKSDSELIVMLGYLGFEYEIGSKDPGIRTRGEEFISYDGLSKPFDYFEDHYIGR